MRQIEIRAAVQVGIDEERRSPGKCRNASQFPDAAWAIGRAIEGT